MAEFEVRTYPIIIEEHPNADQLELARIGDYRSIIQKGKFANGDICAYIPEASIVPDDLITEMGLEGRLTGAQRNRVKAIKLRGVLSQGLIYPMPGHQSGIDVAEKLGITKWEPPIPANMAGEVEYRLNQTITYPMENIKKYPGMFQDGEAVSITEKLHGTWCCLARIDGQPLVSSLGLSEKHLALKINEANRNNLYVRQWQANQELLDRMAVDLGNADFHVLGEIHGGKVQDLKYGLSAPQFRVFDIMVNGQFQSWDFIRSCGWKTVPILYEGPYSREIVAELTDGPTTMSEADHTREGIVICAVPDTTSDLTGERKIAKSISEAYLLRKNATELR